MRDIRTAYALFMSQTPSELVGGIAAVVCALALIAAAWIVSPN